MSKVLVLLAEGFEECEALLVVDLLRRAGIDVETVSVGDDINVKSSHSVTIRADCYAEDADFNAADMIVLPGGMPGTTNLATSPIVIQQCCLFSAQKKLAAICAAPSVLGSLGILEGKKAIAYPGFEKKLKGAKIIDKNVVTDGNITTARALGSGIPFALELIRALEGDEASKNVAEQICWRK